MQFSEIRDAISKQYKIMEKMGELFVVDINRDFIFEKYLSCFPEEDVQEHTCNHCKSFLRQYGSVVAIKNNKLVTLWDTVPLLKPLADYIRSLEICGSCIPLVASLTAL